MQAHPGAASATCSHMVSQNRIPPIPSVSSQREMAPRGKLPHKGFSEAMRGCRDKGDVDRREQEMVTEKGVNGTSTCTFTKDMALFKKRDGFITSSLKQFFNFLHVPVTASV